MALTTSPKTKISRGPQGATTYQNGKYSVTIQPTGEVDVRPDDWLSKYSAAIHDDFFHVHEYARRDTTGRVVSIDNPNLIRSGETLVHMPTFIENFRGPGPKPQHKPTPSDEEKIRITAEAVLKDLNLPGNHLPAAKWIVRAVGPSAGAINVGTIIAEVAAGGAATTGMAALGFAMGALGPLAIVASALISIANGMESGMRLFGLKASVYATVAWAFDERMPPPPAEELSNVERHHANDPKWYMERYRTAWAEAAADTVSGLSTWLQGRHIRPADWKKVLRAIGGDDRRQLALMLWDAGEGGVSRMGTDLTIYQSKRKSIDYPN